MDEWGYMSRGSSGTNVFLVGQKAQYSHWGMREYGTLGKLPGVQAGWGIRVRWGVMRYKAKKISLRQIMKDLLGYAGVLILLRKKRKKKTTINLIKIVMLSDLNLENML